METDFFLLYLAFNYDRYFGFENVIEEQTSNF